MKEREQSHTIVVSAVNLRKGGTLTILRQCLAYLSTLATSGGYRVIALVHQRSLAEYPHIEYIELPWSIKGWGRRLWCEYMTMGRISRELGCVDLWLSLHDTTPRVQARRQAVYCQTSFPFFRWRLSDFRFDPKIPLFGIFTRFAYRIGVHRNRYLIVQQDWLRWGLSQMLGVPTDRFIVAPVHRDSEEIPTHRVERGVYTFFYASTADSHKNFETLCEATRLLEGIVGTDSFRTIITVKGDENRYARWLAHRWQGVRSLHFAGLMDKPTLYSHYHSADCLVFPSRIETWGLPISEYLQTKGAHGAMLLADLPYAHETSAGALRVHFFPPTDAVALADAMQRALEGDIELFSPNAPRAHSGLRADGWAELFHILLDS